MDYRGIRYTIRLRVERDQWIVAIHPGDVEQRGRVMNGNRQQAELLARSMIVKWLEGRPAPVRRRSRYN